MLQDPFGKDSVDLSVHDYVELCINSCNAMVKDMGTAPPFDKDIELQLKYRRSDPIPVVSSQVSGNNEDFSLFMSAGASEKENHVIAF